MEPKNGAEIPPAEDLMDVEERPVQANQESARKQTKREKKEARQARRPVFFERAGHVTFAGAEQVSRG